MPNLRPQELLIVFAILVFMACGAVAVALAVAAITKRTGGATPIPPVVAPAPMSVRCRSCGSTERAGARFCSSCGTTLDSSREAEPEA